MKGFCTTGVMLLPKQETYNARGVDYQMFLKKSINKAIKFFSSKGISFECFTTDELANILRPKGVSWISSSTPEDIFFIRRNVEGFSNILDGKDLTELYESARKRYPVERGMSPEDRLDVVEKRDKLVANKYLSSAKFILSFEHPQNPYYKVKYKENDGRIVMKVSHVNFIVSCIMSGNPIDLQYIVEYQGSNRPLHAWEV